MWKEEVPSELSNEAFVISIHQDRFGWGQDLFITSIPIAILFISMFGFMYQEKKEEETVTTANVIHVDYSEERVSSTEKF